MKNPKLKSLRFFYFIIILLFNVRAFGTNYYFSASTGNDSRTSSEAQNQTTPWKTISKLNSFFASLQPGDSVLFKRGEQYPGSITISSSGTSSLPIVISAYGNGGKPLITGFVTLPNWTSLGNGIYESNANTNLKSTVNMMLLNNTVRAMGRYPNDDAINKGYLTYQSHSGTTSITSSQISGIPNFVDAELVIRYNRFYTDRCVISGQTSTTVTYKTENGSTPIDGFGFFFQNSPNTLDKFGEWYYNPSTHKLRVVLDSLSSYTIKASSIDTLLKASSKSYITVDNLSFQGANIYAVSVYGGSNFIIQNCSISYSGRDAICIAATTGFKVDGCSINYSNNRGINGFQSNATGQTITNNTIKNTGMFPGMGWKKAGDGVLIGIEANTNGSLIKNNTVINSGYIGIRFYGDNTIVQSNYIDSFCINKDDGGGIYTWNGTNATHNGMKIQDNIILNGIGAPQGTNSTNPEAQGIYFDNYSNGVEVTGNTIANCRKGIFLHNSRNIVVRNNTLYNNEYSFRTQFDAGSGITGCTTTSNIFFARLSTQLCTYFTSTANDIGNIGTFDSNYYCRPLLEPNGINSTSGSAGGVSKVATPSSKYYSLDVWNTSYSKDAHSKKTCTTVTDINKIRFEYNATNSPRTVNLSPNAYLGVDGAAYSGTITLQPYTSLILINTGTTLKKSRATNISAETTNKKDLAVKEFSIKAYPNPSANYFNSLIQSGNSDPILIRVIDLSGKVLETESGINANCTFQFGHNLTPGVYIVEAMQGTEQIISQKIIKSCK